MEKEKKFKFIFQIIDVDTTFVDQNVTQFTFINIGNTNAKINNSFLLQGIQVAQANNRFEENLRTGEKTAQGYKIVFLPQPNRNQLIQVIMKVEVPNKD